MELPTWLTNDFVAAVAAVIAAVASVYGVWIGIRAARQQAREESYQRLKLECSRTAANALTLTIDYRPDDLSQGVEAEIAIIHPADAVALPIGAGKRSDGQGGWHPPDLFTTEGGKRQRKTRLGHYSAPAGMMRGSTLIVAPGSLDMATVTVRLVATSSQRRLMARATKISPTS